MNVPFLSSHYKGMRLRRRTIINLVYLKGVHSLSLQRGFSFIAVLAVYIYLIHPEYAINTARVLMPPLSIFTEFIVFLPQGGEEYILSKCFKL